MQGQYGDAVAEELQFPEVRPIARFPRRRVLVPNVRMPDLVRDQRLELDRRQHPESRFGVSLPCALSTGATAASLSRSAAANALTSPVFGSAAMTCALISEESRGKGSIRL